MYPNKFDYYQKSSDLPFVVASLLILAKAVRQLPLRRSRLITANLTELNRLLH